MLLEDEEELELIKDESLQDFNKIYNSNVLDYQEDKDLLTIDHQRYNQQIEFDVDQKKYLPLDSKLNFTIQDKL